MKIIIHGKPQQQERPRASAYRGMVRLYDPPASRHAKALIQNELKDYHILKPSEKPLHVEFHFYIPIPKSYSKKVRKAIDEGTHMAVKRPDLSNYIKLVEDACNGILWHDDSQVVQLLARKEYSSTPRTEIIVKELQPTDTPEPNVLEKSKKR